MKRNSGIDLLKFFCSFMIICIHSSFPGILGYIITPLARVAVPLFFMITGYYYSYTKGQNKELSQIRKIFKLFLGANLLYSLYPILLICFKKETLTSVFSTFFSINSLANFVFLNESPFGGHLWYLGAILYVLIIVFVFEKKWDRKYLYPLVPLLLLVDLVFGKYSLLFFGQNFPYIIVRNFMFVGLPYFLIGDILYKYKAKISFKKPEIFSFIFICTTLLERFLLGNFNLNAVRDHYISTTFLAVAVFLVAIKYENKKQSKLNNAMCFIGAKLSADIYILHRGFLVIMSEIVKHVNNNTLSIIYNYFAPFIAFGVSILSALIIHIIIKKLTSRLHNLQKPQPLPPQ